MKRNLSFLLLVFGVFILFNCAEPERPIVYPEDYSMYMVKSGDQSLHSCNEEIVFWKNRLAKSPDDEVSLAKLASLFSSRFKLTGEVEDLYASDSLYQVVLNSTPMGKAELYQALAVNSITKHEFRQGKKYIQEALEIGDSKGASYLTLVDLNLELGDYDGAKFILKEFENKNSFAYLIRQAKVKDQEGKLDSAIYLMEKALDRIKDDKSLFVWTKSNLADMYGHAGRVKEAYESYLEVLRKDPHYDYALKGIAWIAFSHDHNTAEAKRIIQSIINKKSTPDLHLLLAQIAEFEKNESEKINELKLFTAEARKPKYLGMYNKYLCTLEAEDLQNPARAIEIAEMEIKSRPTPQSFDLLAWGLYHKGDVTKAAKVASLHVENKTYEPEALYHLGMIYKNSDAEKSKVFLAEAAKSEFELGPIVTKKIEAALN